MIEIPLDERDAELLPSLYESFKSFWSDTSEEPRAHYKKFIAAAPIVEGVAFRNVSASEPPGLWAEPASAHKDLALLYLHGGSYISGSADAYQGFISQIVSRTQYPAFILDYPLVPEVSIPIALDLARTAADSLLTKYPRIALVGDSAGGGLALATLANIRDRGRVAAAVLFSPWTDLTLSGRSIQANAHRDVLLNQALLAIAAKGYVGRLPLDDPRASPLFGIPSGLPPILIQVGSEEILLDDALRYDVEARKAGAKITLELWQGMHHVFQLNVKTLASSRRALDRAAAFLRSSQI